MRGAARAERFVEIYHNPESLVVSFKRSQNRINVYWTTGTVGTCIEHPRQGRTQLFRRNVDMTTLRQIFREPRIHTGAGYHRRASQPSAIYGPSRRSLSSFGTTNVAEDSDPADEEAEAKSQLKILEKESAAIEREKAQVQAVLDMFAEKRRRKAAAEAAARAAEAERVAERKRVEAEEKEERLQAARGPYLKFWLCHADHVGDCFSPNVTCVSCGGEATIVLYESGTWAFTTGLPPSLHNKLNGRQITLPSPDYVVIALQDRYYVRFEDGKSECVGCEELHQ